MGYKTEYSAIPTIFAALSGLLFAVGIWFLLTRYLSVDASLAAGISALIGGAEYFAIRYVLSQKYRLPDDEL